MVRRVMLVAFLAIGLAGCASSASSSPSSPAPPDDASTPTAGPAVPAGDDPAAVGRAYVDAIARGDTAAAEAMEDDTMRAAAPASMLEQLWAQLVAQYGAFEGLGDVETQEQAPYTIATVHAAFANATVPLLVTVAGDGSVSGLHLGTPTTSPSPAAYVRPDAFIETEVTVGSAPWQLPGTLAMPEGDGPFPSLVLLAGSGPQDRDETIGVNAPLRDLAWGLASAGIATLRYEKRTRAHAAEVAAATLTVREETIDDAIAAVALLRSTPGIDPARVFVAGHSLGGYLAPRIAAEMEDPPAGIALLAANSSPLTRIILDQLEYLATLDGSYLGPDPDGRLAAIRAQVALAESPDLSPSTPATDLPPGVPASYWLDLRTYDPLATARDLTIPMFLAQGRRDYQVPPSELAAWREALAGRGDVTVREYPALNHLLIAGSGPSTPAEYSEPGHVAEEVVADLAAWILER